MASLLEEDQNAPAPDGGLFGIANGAGDALGHLYSSLKSYLTPEPSPLWPLDSPVGTERVGGDTSVGMPSPDVSPVVGLLGGHPVTAADHARALRIASAAAQFGPADVGAIRAFHGSPADFNAFSNEFIGSGEGAQAFGHGHYAAGAESTAQYYKDTLSKWTDNVAQHVNDITGIDLSEDYLPAIRQIAMGSGAGAGAGSATTALKARVPELRDIDGSSMIGPHPTLEKLIAAIRSDQNKGHMYELNINADPEHFLDWDKPLSEQHDKVVSAVADLAAKKGIPMGNATGARAYEDLASPPYGTRGHGVNDPAALSEALRDAGIPGIKYLDQGSRGKGQGTSNYVIFDPATIEILRKYGIAGLIAGGGAAAAATGGQGQRQ